MYGVEDHPRPAHALALGLQHALLALVFLVYPLAAAQQIGLSVSDTQKFLVAVVLSIGAATCLHGIRRPVGTGALAVEIPTPAFLPTAVLAGSTGGIAMLAGMSLVSGVVELFFAGALRRIRSLFPAEVCGVAVMMLGLSLVRPGILNVFGTPGSEPAFAATPLAVAAVTLATIASIALFGSGRIKLLALGGGVLAGTSLSWVTGLAGSRHWAPLAASGWIGTPDLEIGTAALKPELLPLCIVMALILAIDNVGMLIGIQRQANPGWSRIDVQQAGSGIRVSSIGDLIAGLLGGMPTGISSANISLAHATGAVARRISFITAALLVLAAFSPKAIKAVSMIPRPVVGAVMVYAAAYMLVSGMTLFLGRLLNERRMFVVGLSIVVGLCPAVAPTLFTAVSPTLRPILESPLALGSFCAILLTQLLRIGAAKKAELTVELPSSENEMVHELSFNKAIRPTLLELGASAGASRPAVYRAIDVSSEIVACLKVAGHIGHRVTVVASFVDSRLQLTLGYDGDPPPAVDSSRPDDVLQRLYAQTDVMARQRGANRSELTVAFDS
ncbi:MAG: hypothetical protein RLZZ393_2128 [Pseudomonadota bacterium]|jgi:xanthine/uracil permease